MPEWLEILLLVTATTGTGLVGGIFFAFSNFVMKALAQVPATEGAEVMQRINVTVLNPLFFAVLFGTGVIALIVAVATPNVWNAPGAVLSRIAAALYLFGTLGVTIVRNVPLNERLAVTALTDATLSPTWAHYLEAWTWWNHVRTIAALLAAALFAAAIAL
jgi:uncharacterized membrane protein